MAPTGPLVTLNKRAKTRNASKQKYDQVSPAAGLSTDLRQASFPIERSTSTGD